MLTHLTIYNLAVVEQLELLFNSGMTVLTGETGAGKSILIDALSLTLGARAENGMIRAGTKTAEISANFALEKLPMVSTFLQEHALEAEGDCVVRRMITEDGRSRAFINGKTVPLTQLRQLGELLVNIHGQHQHQSLLNPDYQRLILDAYANHDALLDKVKIAYQNWQQLKKSYKELLSVEEQQEKLALLQYQFQELKALNLQKDELEALDAEHKKLTSSAHWIHLVESTLLNLENEVSEGKDIITLMHNALTCLAPLKQQAPLVGNSYDLLSAALINIKEASLDLKSFRDSLNIDPERLTEVELRISQIHNLARKNRIKPEALLEHQAILQQEISKIGNLQTHLAEYNEKLKAAEEHYLAKAKALSSNRKNSALELEALVTQSLSALEMPHGNFKINFSEKSSLFSSNGYDEIEFLVSTNPGLPLQPLRKIASGGELSRISLAIQVISAQKITTPTLIFDEVDVGISGKTAERVGKLLRKLGKETQVLCVTHLPQVAAQGHYHYKVEKYANATSTQTKIALLEENERAQEIARMLGGVTITKHAIAHANEMLELSKVD
jgi:DNA repair protein RecN (Recombination protein N)